MADVLSFLSAESALFDPDYPGHVDILVFMENTWPVARPFRDLSFAIPVFGKWE